MVNLMLIFSLLYDFCRKLINSFFFSNIRGDGGRLSLGWWIVVGG